MAKTRKLRKVARWAGIAIAILGLVGLVTLPSIRDSYKTRAVLTQRVQVDKAGASLFGDGTTPIGSPQFMIIDDPKAIVDQPKSNTGPRQVDDAYLQQHHIYPLQLKTVDFTLHLAQTALIAGVVFGLLVAFFSRPKREHGFESVPE
jgi:hypothetical protein